MKKVYVVTSGEYSDYRIVAIFSTEQKAQEYIDKYGTDNVLSYSSYGYAIDEYEIDPIGFTLPSGLIPYAVSMHYNGETFNVTICDPEDFKEEYEIIQHKPFINDPVGYNTLRVFCIAKDTKHAVKITNEKRAQLIARGEFTEHNDLQRDSPMTWEDHILNKPWRIHSR